METRPITTILNGGKPVTTEAQLNAAIAQANGAAAGAGAFQIRLGANIALASELQVISLKSGVTLDIAGGHAKLDGRGAQEGFFVYSGVVTIEDLTIQNMVAQGGAGASGLGGGGGGAGLGGGLFVADDAANGAVAGNVTLTDVSFQHDAAIGGAGGDGVNSGKTQGAGGTLNGDRGFLAANFGNAAIDARLVDGGSGGGLGGRFGAGKGGRGNVSYYEGQPYYSAGGGGGGLGAGGDIFVQHGATLVIAGNGSLAAGTVVGGKGGAAGRPGGLGSAYGNGVFLEVNQSITFAPGVGQIETIAGAIADMTRSADPSGRTGAGSIIVNGPGTLALTANNPFTGGITIEQGALELAAYEAVGSGPITFSVRPGMNASLVIDAAAQYVNGQTDYPPYISAIAGFGAGAAIDLKYMGYAAGATATLLSSDVLAVSSNGKTIDLTLLNPGAQNYVVTDDGNGGVLVKAAPPITTEAGLNAAILAADAAAAGSGALTITLAGSIALNSPLAAIDLQSGVTLNIAGGNYAIDGGGKQSGLSVHAGILTVENLTIRNMVAQGGQAASGAGAAGLGGGLFIANHSLSGDVAGAVTLTNVSFVDDDAIGGAAGSAAGSPGQSGAFGAGGGYGGGAAGFGGGASGAGAGGGLGAGGAIFVERGASLTIAGQSSIAGGAVTGGAGHGGGGAGAAYGGGVFLQGNQSMTFAPGAGQTETISDVVADMTGSQDPSGQTGAGSIVDAGPGALVLAAANTFVGGITVQSGVLELAANGAGGSGAISFASPPVGEAVLVIDAAAMPAGGQVFANAIANFGDGDAIDIKGLAYDSKATAIVTGDDLAVTSKGHTVTFALIDQGATSYDVYTDGSGNVLVNDVPTTDQWSSGVSADWAVASDWSAVIAPNAGGDATIAVKGTYTIGIAAGESFSIHNLAMRNATATLDVAGQLNLSGVLTLARGTIRLDNGGGVAGSVTVAAGATLVGAGTVDGAAQSAGTIEASGGALTIAGPVTGTGGALLIDNGATLNLGAAVSGDNIAFAAAGKSVLTLGAAGSVASAISGFATGDAIDLEKLRATSDSYAGGVLSLFDGAARVASLSIVGSYAGQVFALSADGAGGTDVTLAPAAVSSHNLALFAQAIAAFGPTEAWVTGRADGLALEQRHFDLALARQ